MKNEERQSIAIGQLNYDKQLTKYKSLIPPPPIEVEFHFVLEKKHSNKGATFLASFGVKKRFFCS